MIPEQIQEIKDALDAFQTARALHTEYAEQATKRGMIVVNNPFQQQLEDAVEHIVDNCVSWRDAIITEILKRTAEQMKGTINGNQPP